MLGWLTGEVVGALAGVAGLLAAFFGVRWKAKRDGKKEMAEYIRLRTWESLERAKQIEKNIDSLSNAGTLDRMREQGWIRND